MQKKIYRILAAVLVLALVVGILPVFDLGLTASATDEKDVVYNYIIDISKYRVSTEKHDANNADQFDLEAVYTEYPEKDGYVFAGWYTDPANKVPLGKEITNGGAYAKFVPEQLMKAVAQVSITTDYATPSSSIRFVAAVESFDYAQVGFLLNKEGSSKTYTHASTQVYTNLSAAVEGGSLKPGFFHASATHMFALTLSGVKDQRANYVATPFWITYDGTKVDHIPTANKTVEMGINANVAAGRTEIEEEMQWYTGNTEVYYINSLSQFRAFVEMSNSYNFAGKTVKLNTDIAFNEGIAGDKLISSGSGNPLINGAVATDPIGTKDVPFAGTFDGQGHTISGLVSKTGYDALFAAVKDATIKNVKVARSTLRAGSGGGCAAGLVGTTYGTTTIENVYIGKDVNLWNATHQGGVVAYNQGNLTIKNTWSEAYVNPQWGANVYIGGIVGDNANTAGLTLKLENCLYSGSMAGTAEGASFVGGLIGAPMNNPTITTVTDCLVAGNMTGLVTSTGTLYIGSVIGSKSWTAAKTVTADVYATVETYKNAEGAAQTIRPDQSFKTGTVIAVEKANILGDAAKTTLIGLNFEKDWAARNEDTPCVKTDKQWYETDASEYVIYTAEELLAFANAAKTNDFSGKTVKLGADITLNKGNAATWETQPPTNIWPTITTEFKGTFDGCGHTIYGLYLNSAATDYDGMFKLSSGTIKNVIFENSYVTGAGKIGTVIGAMTGGSVTNVHVKGTVKGSDYVGGLIGYHAGGEAITIDGCSFDGTLSGNSNLGGILAFKQNAGNEIIKNCTVSGTITGTGIRMGGIAGFSQFATGTITVENCKVDATISNTSTSQSDLGGILGCYLAATATVKNCHFSGAINAGAYGSGGIIGAQKTNTTIENCSFTGSVTGQNHWIGGMIGYVYGGTMTLKNNMSTGKIVSKHTSNTAVGSLIGRNNNGTVNATGCFGVGNTYYNTSTLKTAQVGQGTVNGSTALLPDVVRDLMEAYYAAGIALDFTGGFANFDGTVSFNISTAGQLFAFNLMGQCYDFGGKTVILTEDITINEGNAADWATKAPKYNWDPIGDSEGAVTFAGTFTGQGHTISGLYCTLDNGNSLGMFREVTGTVTNFKLTNAYLANTVNTTWGYNGGIVSYLNGGTVSRVYTDAVVETVGAYAGGIAGMTGGATATVSECIFNGTLNARCYVDKVCDNQYGTIRAHARYVGGIAGNIDATNTVVKDCIFSGMILNTDNGAHRTGGIIGGAYNAGKTATITGCFSIGGFRADATSYHFNMIMDFRNNSGATQATNADTLFEDNYVLAQQLYALDGKTGLNVQNGVTTNITGGNQASASTIRYTVPKMIETVAEQYECDTGVLDFGRIWKYRTSELPVLRWTTGETVTLNTHYITTETGRQLMAVSMPDKTYDTFTDMTIQETETGTTYKGEVDGESVDLPYYYLEQVNAAPVEFKDIFYGYGTYLTKYTGTTLLDTRDLINDMKAFGFVEQASSNLNDDCYYTALTYGDAVYAVTHFAETGETYISVSEEQKLSPYMDAEYFKTAVNTAGGEPYTEHKDVTITSVALRNGGDAFVIRLKNGHFIVIDGGTNNQTDRNAVAAALGASAENYQSGDNSKNNNPQIVVDAWFFTHAHADHTGLFRGGIYGAIQVDVYIKGFYYNFTEKWHEDAKIKVGSEEVDGYVNMAYAYADQDDNGKNFYTKGTGDTSEWWLERTSTHKTASVVNNPSWDGASTKQNIPIYRVQAGQKFYFDGMTVEIPYTQEQVQPSQMHLDLNGTCSWYLLTDDYGQTFLDAGDAERWNAEAVTEFYSPNYKLYGTDVGKTFHHGLNPLVKYTGTGSPAPSGSTNSSYNYSLVDAFYGVSKNVGDGQQTKFVFVTKGETSWLQISGYNNAAGSQRDLSIHEMRYLFGYVLTSKYGTTVSNVKNYPTISTKISFAAYGGEFTNGNYTDTFEGTTTVTMAESGITWDKHHTRGIYK